MLPGSALRAEKTLRRMQNLGSDGEYIAAEPGVVSYTSVMMAWSRVTNPEEQNIAVAKCEQLLQEMLEKTKAGNRLLMPNQFTFGTFLQVVSRSSVPDKKERATQVLKFMEQCGIKPDPIVLRAAQECSS